MSVRYVSDAYDGRVIALTIEEAVNTVANTSTLSWTLSSEGGSVNYYTIGETTVKINGTQVYHKARTDWDEMVFPAKKGSVSGSITVAHNSDGSKNVEIVFDTRVYVWQPKSYGGTLSLTKIDRNAPTVGCAVNINSSTSITIVGTANSYCDLWEYSLNGGSTYVTFSSSGSYLQRSVTVTCTSSNHNVKVRARKTSNQIKGTSATVAVDTTLPTVTLSVSSITSSSFYISASSSVTADLWDYSINNGQTWVRFSSTAGTNASITITGLTPNVTYSVKVRARKSKNLLYGTSATTSVLTLGGSLLNSVTTFFADASVVSIPINWTVYNSTYTHTFIVKKNGTTIFSMDIGRGNTGTGNKTITVSAANRTALLNAMSNMQSGQFTFVLQTYSGSTQIGSDATKSAYIKTSEDLSSPTFGGFTYRDVNSTTVAVTGDDQILIKSYSRLTVYCQTATAKNGASIVSYTATVNGLSKISTTTTISYGIVNVTGTINITVKVTDSRGYSATVTVPVTVLNYEPIQFDTWSIRRLNEVEQTVQLNFEGSLSPVTIDSVAKNTLQRVVYQYKETDASSWSSTTVISGITTSGSGFSYSNLEFLSLDEDKSYYVRISAADKITSVTIELLLNKGTPLVAYRSKKVGINKVDPKCALDVNGDISMNGFNVQGYVGEIDNTIDLDDVTSGIYLASGNSTSLHYPSATTGILEVIELNSSLIIQRFTDVSLTKIYIRKKITDEWSTWKSTSLT